uniref:Uncharacterized protein n=1 Tax=Arundo donax TaxID=35708 RepID=A0A0A8XVH9_ARUDO
MLLIYPAKNDNRRCRPILLLLLRAIVTQVTPLRSTILRVNWLDDFSEFLLFLSNFEELLHVRMINNHMNSLILIVDKFQDR